MLGLGAVTTVNAGAAVLINGWSCKEKEITHLTSVDTLDWETDMAAEGGGTIGQGWGGRVIIVADS